MSIFKNNIILNKPSYLLFRPCSFYSYFHCINNSCLQYNILSNSCILNGGIAIASIQVGLRKNYFLIYNRLNRNFYCSYVFYLFINSYPLWLSNDIYLSEEGCLSLRNSYFVLYRCRFFVFITFIGGRFVKVFVYGFFSVCFQHEINHLLGILISM